ncbi:MAG: peptidoglycan DD-metalloendopeptidase family protein [Lentilitoribacter sp.]
MSNFKLSQPQRVVLKTLSAMFLAGTVTGCSSDLSRFSYYQALNGDGLTTASVKTPHAGSLAPVGVGTQSFPGDVRQPVRNSVQHVASVAPQQAYPGDISSPVQSSAPLYTASIPSQPSVSQPATPLIVQKPVVTAPIVTTPIVRQPVAAAPVIKQPLAAPKRTPLVDRVRQALAQKKKTTLENTVESASVQRMPIIRPISQPDVDTQIVTGAVATNTSSPVNIVPMAPDPMVTGSIPDKTKVSRGGWSTANGARVTLREGETVYNLSRRYGVPAAEILNANDIRDSRTLKVGQSLIIPTYVYSQAATVSAPDNDPLTKSAYSHSGSRTLFPQGSAAPVPVSRIDTAMLAPTSQASPLDTSKPVRQAALVATNIIASGQYTVASGDTLNRIAYKNGVTVEALKAANNIKTSNIRIGQKLVIPSKTYKTLAPDQTTTASVTKVETNTSQSSPVVASTTTVNKDKITETAKVDSNVAAPAKTGISRLRWPAKGQIASSFGGKTDDGKRNDGLDILMPEGSDVKAAENGVVIYASNGLKGYGNTVLVRHDGDIVTVYAHAKSLNVKRGDKVQRGQVIAQSGMTGSAKRPKLHFEVRKNATPQNPIKFLE